MAAATQSLIRMTQGAGEQLIATVRMSAMTSDQVENLSYTASRCPPRKPDRVLMRVVTEPTARCLLQHSCNVDNAVAASQYVPVRVYTEVGGDITGAVVEFDIYFNGVSSGGFVVA